MPSKEIAEFVLAQIQGYFLLRKTHKDNQLIKRNFDMLATYINRWSTTSKRRIKHG